VVDSPFNVGCPETSLSQVVLPQEHIERILALVENYDAYLEKRGELHLDETISYGRAIVILEYGPPGTGKTLLARALSNHTGRPLVSFKRRRDHGDPFRHNGFAENVVKPKYMGKGLNLSPFMIIFSVIFWAAVLGPLGAILGVPMTLLFKELVLEADDQNRWMARLMSSKESRRVPLDNDSEGDAQTE